MGTAHKEAIKPRGVKRALRWGLAPWALLLVHTTVVASSGAGNSATRMPPSRPAIGYYIVAQAPLLNPNLVQVFGASNLPAGSVLAIWVYEPNERGTILGGARRAATVGKDGLFRTEIHARPGLSFKLNSICDVIFQPGGTQPPNVTRAVGSGGEGLGVLGVNPEVSRNSTGQALHDVTVVGQ